ncbi:MAG: hypothetical protein HY913_14575 [Desulfomonile tiedjei]|nr:hypothetical protein [Desulfomonile tiedjei]
MSLTFDQIKRLVQGLSMTRDHELNCNECLDKMAEFAECELTSKPIPDSLEAVQHHLNICGECDEEYEALLTALQHMNKDESGPQEHDNLHVEDDE